MNTLTEIGRLILICGGFFVVGMNLVVIVRAGDIVKSTRGWRLYMIGQTFFTLAAIVGMYRHLHQPFGLAASLVAVAIFSTVVSLVLLEREYRRGHPYHHHLRKRVSP